MVRVLIAAAVACLAAACGFTAGAVSTGPGDGSTPGADAPITDARRPIDAPPDAPAAPAVTFLQSAAAAGLPWNNSGTTVSVQLTQPTTAGDLLAVYVSYDDSTSLSSVTDDAGNVYTITGTVDDTGDGQKSSMAYAKNITGGATTLTATIGASKCCRLIIVHELRGADPDAPLDGYAGQHQSSPGTAANNVTPGTITTTGSGDYIFAATSNASNKSGEMITTGTGATARVALRPADGNPSASEELRQTAPGPIAATFTYSVNGDALTQQMAFKP